MMCMRLRDPPQMRRVRQSVGSRNIPRPKHEFKMISVFPRTLRNKGKSQYALKGVCKFVLCAGDTDCGLVQRSLLFQLPGWFLLPPLIQEPNMPLATTSHSNDPNDTALVR